MDWTQMNWCGFTENRTDNEMILIGEDPLPPRTVRYYEFLHGQMDVPLAEHDARVERDRKDPFLQTLQAEIQKEIDRECIRLICETSLKKDVDVKKLFR